MGSLFFVVLFILCLYFTGLFFSSKLSLSNSDCSNLAIGFVFQIAIIEILGWWMVTYKMPMVLFVSLVLLVCVGVTIFGVITNIGRERNKNKF